MRAYELSSQNLTQSPPKSTGIFPLVRMDPEPGLQVQGVETLQLTLNTDAELYLLKVV